MNKRLRQYLGIFFALVGYYLFHEGAHFLFAVWDGNFKDVNFLGLGIQIDVFAELMSAKTLGWFCLVGATTTLAVAYALVFLRKIICKSKSKVFKACAYYVNIALLLLDPLYLSVLCGFFGGGDMNGISNLIPEIYARIGFGIILILNLFVFLK